LDDGRGEGVAGVCRGDMPFQNVKRVSPRGHLSKFYLSQQTYIC